MKNLREFVKSLNEAKKSEDLEKIEGKDAEKNGTGGKTGFNEPVDDDAEPDFLPRAQWDINMSRLELKFESGDDFFIIGRAGWGKTSIIESFARKYGYEVVTQYLDKCEATDLGGIPIAGEDKKTGKARRMTLMPEWAQYIKDHPERDFLLFFDEMNQAAPDVMNALMPIVLKHEICGERFDNILVGAAGNFESENGAVNELSGPLRSRFKPLIEWESGTTKAWESAVAYMHKKWDSVVTKEFIDELAQVISLFDNPREVEQKFIERYVARFIQKGRKYYDVDQCKDNIERLIEDPEVLKSATGRKQIADLAELTFRLVNNGGKLPEDLGRGKKKTKDKEMVPDNIKKLLSVMMTQGCLAQEENGKVVTYGISKENISVDFFEDDTNMNSEMLRRLIAKFEQDGLRWKYETDDDWKTQHPNWKDPAEDMLINMDFADLWAKKHERGSRKTTKRNKD